jgi:hypothetical protein
MFDNRNFYHATESQHKIIRKKNVLHEYVHASLENIGEHCTLCVIPSFFYILSVERIYF